MIKKLTILLIPVLFAMVSCTETEANSNKTETVDKKETLETTKAVTDKDGAALYKEKCLVCHDVKGKKTHDDLLAPPMRGVKRHYSDKYAERDDFIKHVIEWATAPDEKKSLMLDAVEQFKVMPNLNFQKEDVEKIAAYIYDNEMDKPEWAGKKRKGDNMKCGSGMK